MFLPNKTAEAGRKPPRRPPTNRPAPGAFIYFPFVAGGVKASRDPGPASFIDRGTGAMGQQVKHVLGWMDVYKLAGSVWRDLQCNFRSEGAFPCPLVVYPVPRGGIHAAQALMAASVSAKNGLPQVRITNTPELCHVIIDDIVDSGKTMLEHKHKYRNMWFVALVDKINDERYKGAWVEFPWETLVGETGPQDNIRRILEYIGEDPSRPGLLETPDRVVKSYEELFAGYRQSPIEILKTFEDGAAGYDEIILQKNIPFTSFCEHHMLQFEGLAHVAYIPDGRIVGLSKMGRLVDVFAKRLQVQERLTTQIAETMYLHLKAKAAACIIEAEHSCMGCRGVRKKGSRTVTSCLRGAFLERPEARMELMALIRG